jgi:hypothetical protein
VRDASEPMALGTVPPKLCPPSFREMTWLLSSQMTPVQVHQAGDPDPKYIGQEDVLDQLSLETKPLLAAATSHNVAPSLAVVSVRISCCFFCLSLFRRFFVSAPTVKRCTIAMRKMCSLTMSL